MLEEVTTTGQLDRIAEIDPFSSHANGGMAPGVHAALLAALGADALETLTIEGRHRRDVY